MTRPRWNRLTLTETSEGGRFSDGDWVESKDQDPAGGVRLTQLADVGIGRFRDRSNRWLREDQARRLACTFLEPDDVLIARMPDPLGRACLVPHFLGRAVTAVDVAILRVRRRDVDARFVMWAINSPRFHEAMVARQSGTTRKRISRKNLASLSIPVAPVAEQRRIVEVLEDHLSRLDAADKYLVTGSARLGTMSWLLLRSHPSLRQVESVPLGEVLAAPLANGRSVPTRKGGFPVLRLTALKSGTIDLRERKAGDWSAADAKPFLVEQGDFLVSRGNGSLSLVARGGLVSEAPDAVAYPDTLIRVRTDRSRVDADYLALLWNSPVVRRQVESMARTTAGIYKVNQGHLRSVTLPLPALPVQRQLAQEITRQVESSARLEADIALAQARSVALRRALLEAAFTGRLTGPVSDDEVAEELAEV